MQKPRPLHKRAPITCFLFLWVALVGALLAVPAQAVPAFARQTGENCVACHTAFPELTPFGREFKLNGYTWGERQALPLALMMQGSLTQMAQSKDAGGRTLVPHLGDLQFDRLTAFAAGKITDNVGGYTQWAYNNNQALGHDGGTVGHAGIHDFDLRAVKRLSLAGKDLVLGLNLNNNPTLQDVWNSTPVWRGMPFTGSNLPRSRPQGGLLLDGALGQKVVGLGAYAWWDRQWYGELSTYGSAVNHWRVLSTGVALDQMNRLHAYNNPYWRLAWNREWGAHSLMLGHFGMVADKYPDPGTPHGATDRFTDLALDAQYQYLSDPSIFSLAGSLGHERQNRRASHASGEALHPVNHLQTLRLKASYLYERTYGVSLAYSEVRGSADAGLYGKVRDSATGALVSDRPDTRSYIAEFDYNFNPQTRLIFQYTGFLKWNGATANIDGRGRKPSDNNILFMGLWFLF
ncbi:MAG: cytochrome C [Curvibacter sp.]|nr:MAG: cytochrome C [Curvibacter sp.]